MMCTDTRVVHRPSEPFRSPFSVAVNFDRRARKRWPFCHCSLRLGNLIFVFFYCLGMPNATTRLALPESIQSFCVIGRLERATAISPSPLDRLARIVSMMDVRCAQTTAEGSWNVPNLTLQ